MTRLPFPRLPAAALTAALLLPAGAAAQAPGQASGWAPGGKTGIGTSITAESRVWYTLGPGQLQEVYHPTLDVANVTSLELLVAGPDGPMRDGVRRRTSLADERSLTYAQTDELPGRWRLTRTYATDPARATVLVRVLFEPLDGGGYRLFVRYDPSLAGSGMCDSGELRGGMLLARDSGGCDPEGLLDGASVASALASSLPFAAATNGYKGTGSDGLVDLADGRLDAADVRADEPGNLVQTAELPVAGRTELTLALGFGPDGDAAAAVAAESLAQGWQTVSGAYAAGWHGYLDSLKPAPLVVRDHDLTALYNVSLMGLRAHEDKTFPGANVASLSNPWGEAMDADLCCRHGYHAVWARDLYHVSTAQIAAGDRAAANRSLDYLFSVQQKPDGGFPQNTRLDGTPIWGSLQMDEVAFPILLAWQLDRTDAATWAKVKLSADHIVDHGPDTPQERWEENSGASPSTIAAEIAGLVAAAEIASANGDGDSAARYLEVADLWQGRLAEWTYTTTGPLPHGEGRYFLRIAPNGQPDRPDRITIANGGGSHDQRAIVDPSFLELVRLGVYPADHAFIARSVAVVDAVIGYDAPGGGRLFHRYNHDGYGETVEGLPYTGAGRGRLWPLLSGERGQYELMLGRDAVPWLLTMAETANEGLMLPEQVWDGHGDVPGHIFGEGTGSATPLAWSMAQFVRLALGIDAGAPVDLPSITAERYGKR